MIVPPTAAVALSRRDQLVAEMRQMEGEKFDLGIEVTFLKGRLKEAKEENEARTAEADALKLRIAKATQVLILQSLFFARKFRGKLH